MGDASGPPAAAAAAGALDPTSPLPSCPQTLAHGERDPAARHPKPRLPVLWFRSKAARKAVAVGGSGPLTRPCPDEPTASTSVRSLGAQSPAACTGVRWALLGLGSRGLRLQTHSWGTAPASGMLTPGVGALAPWTPEAWLLVLPGHGMLCGRSRCASGWKSCCQAEIANGLRDCAHRLRLREAIQGSALAGAWGTEADCTLGLDTRGHVPDLRCSLHLAIRRYFASSEFWREGGGRTTGTQPPRRDGKPCF